MEKFIQYTENFKYGFSKRIVGANQQEINELKELTTKYVGVSLPQIYKKFLSYMGHSSGLLSLIHGGTFDITNVIEHYKIYVASGDSKVTPNCITIGYDDSDSFSLECVGDFDNPPVFITNYGEKVKKLSDSFLNFLYRESFLGFYGSEFMNNKIYKSKDSSIFNSLKERIKDIGYDEKWFSDSVVFCGEGKNSIVSIDKINSNLLYVTVQFNKKKSMIKDAFTYFKKPFEIKELEKILIEQKLTTE